MNWYLEMGRVCCVSWCTKKILKVKNLNCMLFLLIQCKLKSGLSMFLWKGQDGNPPKPPGYVMTISTNLKSILILDIWELTLFQVKIYAKTEKRIFHIFIHGYIDNNCLMMSQKVIQKSNFNAMTLKFRT